MFLGMKRLNRCNKIWNRFALDCMRQRRGADRNMLVWPRTNVDVGPPAKEGGLQSHHWCCMLIRAFIVSSTRICMCVQAVTCFTVDSLCCSASVPDRCMPHHVPSRTLSLSKQHSTLGFARLIHICLNPHNQLLRLKFRRIEGVSSRCRLSFYAAGTFLRWLHGPCGTVGARENL